MKVGIAVIALVVGILLAEGGLRLWMRAQGHPFDTQAARFRIRSILSPIARFVPATVGIDLPDGARRPVLNPYYGSEEEADMGGVFKHFREDARPDDFEVLLLGGSVAAYLGVSDGDAFRAAFQDRPELRGRRVVFLNGAHAAHKQPQQVTRVAVLLAFGYRPDLVLALDGFNESALAVDNALGGLNPLWPSAPVWGAVVTNSALVSPERMEVLVGIWDLRERTQSLVNQCLRFGLDSSALGSKYVFSRLETLSRQRNDLQGQLQALGAVDPDARARRQAGGPDFEPETGAVLQFSVQGWRESSRSLRALCDSRGIPYVHFMQPALFDTGSKPMSPEESQIQNPRESWLVGARDGYPMLRAAAAELAAGGEHFVDASRVFAEVHETLYVDPCHVNLHGNQLLREFMLAHFPKDVLATR